MIYCKGICSQAAGSMKEPGLLEEDLDKFSRQYCGKVMVIGQKVSTPLHQFFTEAPSLQVMA